MLTVTDSFPQILGCAPLHRCYLLLSNKKTSDTSDSQTVTRLMVMKKVLFSSFHVNDARFLFVHMFFHDNNRSHFVLIYSTIFSPKLVKHQGDIERTKKRRGRNSCCAPSPPAPCLSCDSVPAWGLWAPANVILCTCASFCVTTCSIPVRWTTMTKTQTRVC